MNSVRSARLPSERRELTEFGVLAADRLSGADTSNERQHHIGDDE